MVLGQVVILDTVCFKTFDEIALSCTVKETEVIWCLSNLKIDNDPHFWGRVIFGGKLGRAKINWKIQNGRHFS